MTSTQILCGSCGLPLASSDSCPTCLAKRLGKPSDSPWRRKPYWHDSEDPLDLSDGSGPPGPF
jgi:hypothetical protein